MDAHNLSSRPPVRQSASTLGAVLVLLLAGAGCRERGVPPHDRLPLETIQAFFAAARAGDADQADAELRRLEDIPGGGAFAALARRDVLVRRYQTGIVVACGRGDVDAAQALLRQAHQQVGPIAELEPLDRLVSALATLQAYVRQEPFPSSAAAERALQPVLAREAELAGAPAFRAWLDAKKAEIDQMRRREVVQEMRQLVLAYDAALVAGRPEADGLLSRLQALPPATPAAAAALALLGATPEALAAYADQPDAWANPNQGLYLEIRFGRVWHELPADVRNRLALQTLPAEPCSLSGLLLRARLAALKGSRGQAAAWSERLLRSAPVGQPLIQEGLHALALPREQYQARAWLTPFPVLTDYLDRIEQLRQSRR
jgi:hypothetical protein